MIHGCPLHSVQKDTMENFIIPNVFTSKLLKSLMQVTSWKCLSFDMTGLIWDDVVKRLICSYFIATYEVQVYDNRFQFRFLTAVTESPILYLHRMWDKQSRFIILLYFELVTGTYSLEVAIDSYINSMCMYITLHVINAKFCCCFSSWTQ